MDRSIELNVAVRACRDCQLGGLRAGRGGIAVPAYPGSLYKRAGLAILSDRPGPWEEEAGVPFAGPNGDVLDGILEEAGVAREALLILNLLACAVPQGEGPQDYPDAYANCEPHVKAALAHYAPRVVLLMGGPAIQTIFGKEARVGTTRGMSKTEDGRTYVATYHPTALMRRDVDPQVRDWLIEDVRLAAARLRDVNSADENLDGGGSVRPPV